MEEDQENDAAHGDQRLALVLDQHSASAATDTPPVTMETPHVAGHPIVAEDDAIITIDAVDAGLGAHLEQPSTPKDTNCKDHLKPVVGMVFDTLTDVETFYKSYAHEVGFSVRVGQQKKENDEILFKRFICSREGHRQEKKVSSESKKKRKSPNVMETRCGCEAHIVVKLDIDKKYKIHSMVEAHSHGFVSPDKRHLLRSNRNVSERAKSTLFNCHKASIGTSQAYRLLHVSEGGFEHVGCTKRDFQNYYSDGC